MFAKPQILKVLLPLPLQAYFDYLPPQPSPHIENRIPETGKRVTVPFGKSKIYTGIICAITEWDEGHAQNTRQQLKNIRHAIEVLDDSPVVSLPLLELYQWIAQYYMCSAGEVMKASLPAGLKLENEPYTRLSPYCDIHQAGLNNRELLVIEALMAHESLPFSEIAELLEIKNIAPFLQKMEHKGLIVIEQKVSGSYTVKTLKHVRLNDRWSFSEAFASLLAQTNNAPKQQAVLMLLYQAFQQKKLLTEKEILERCETTTSTLNALRVKELVEFVYIPVDRLANQSYTHQQKNIILNDEQQNAYTQIINQATNTKPKPVLLHGVTGSGKTYVYIEVIRNIIAQGKQALYLLPEIGLTKQIIDKLKTEFGEQVGVYHSRFTSNERTDIWLKLLRKEYQIVIGVRSAMLLPFDNLGLIIVDEEHDASFKQSEPNPRYHARDVAVYYAHKYNIPLVLGSATPSIESYYNALQGKYQLVEIKNRAVQKQLPEVVFVNMTQQVDNHLSFGLLSDTLLDAIRETVARQEQVILFNHRRAYAYYLQCDNCGYVPKCIYCDVSLSVHKKEQTIRCHYCGYAEPVTEQCNVCKNHSLKQEGVGTERLEEHLAEIFPTFRIVRMDIDTTRGKHALTEIISQFEKGEFDILVGTQMVTKGLDFANATLAAVVQADKLLNFPDFRANENTYQLLTQFSGRPGRGDKPGRVLIQTYNPMHPVLMELNRPYRQFYDLEIAHRGAPAYPPFSRLIRLELQHKEQLFLEQEGRSYGQILQNHFKGFMLGPEYPIISRLRNHYRLQILIKVKEGVKLSWVKSVIAQSINYYYQNAPQKTLRFVIDVDPR